MKITLDRCQACGGVWLDGGEIHRVIAHYRGQRNGASSGILDEADPFAVFDAADVLRIVFEVLGTLLEGVGDIF